jgi:trehalose 6-phosphate synthase
MTSRAGENNYQEQEVLVRKDEHMSIRIVTDAALSQTSSQSLQADRLIIATNRGPVEYYLDQNNILKHRRGAGGVVTALMGARNRVEMTWVAMAMTEGDRLAVREAQQHGGLLQSPLPGRQMQLRYVTIPKVTYRKHYETISNQVLWFLQHYLFNPNETTQAVDLIRDAWHNGYCKANQAIAEAICAEIERKQTPAVVMLHDYHLYLASAIIRQHHPSIVMQQFIHIPWPAVRYWQSFLPNALTQAIYSSLVRNDILGFQTERDAQNFLEGARTLLDGADVDGEKGTITWRNHRTLVRDYPISISVSDERRIVQSTAGKRATERIRPLLGQQTIMRVDRIEPTKNIVQGFRAYQHLLERHPELRGQVTFLAFLVPSRQSVPRYQRYQAEVLEVIKEINQQYGSTAWTPIHAVVENDRMQALAAMQFYDVLLVNPFIDGMNLVAKEGPVVNQRNGVLVLSRTAGAFQQLGKASVPTSPTDILETAEALYQALTMSAEERRLKAKLAQHIVERYNLEDWMARQIGDMNQVIEDRSGNVSYEIIGPPVSLLDRLTSSSTSRQELHTARNW